MNSIRDLLLRRHADAEPRLDALSRDVLATMRSRQTSPGAIQRLREWLWPSPAAWAATAAAFVVLLALNSQFGDMRHVPVVALNDQAANHLAALRDQRRLYVELVTGEPAPAPRTIRPQSERNKLERRSSDALPSTATT